jgi:hypothetical protein
MPLGIVVLSIGILIISKSELLQEIKESNMIVDINFTGFTFAV